MLGEARTILAGFTGAAVPLDVLPVFIDLCGSLGELSDGSAGDPLTPVLDAVTLAAAAAAILLSVLGGGPVGDFPAPLSRHVHRLLRQVPADDTAPAPAELVEYITAEPRWAGCGGSGLARCARGRPEHRYRGAGGLAVGHRRGDAGRRRRAPLAQDVLAGLVAALDAQVGPWVDSLPPGELRDVATFIRPLLEVAALALPALVAGDLTAADAQRLRDQLDVLLTQLFGPLVIRVSDSVLRPYFRQGAVQLRALADAVDRADPAYADFFAVANRFGLIFRINETIVSAALRETAEIVSIVESVGFDSALKLMNAFVLLPEPALERRAELARLVGGDAARVGDAELRAGLLEAMFVDSHELALRMIPPSLRMSALIAAEQGPLPLVTLFNDAKAVGAAMARTADDLEQAGTDAVNLIADLLERGRVSAEELLAFGEDLKALVHDLADVVHSVLGVVKDLLWPVWVVSTGGWGLAFPELYDQFFDGADWIVDLIQGALDDVADALVTSAIVVAQDLGILDTGSGGDLGQLGQFVRQRALGDPDQAGVTIQLGPGSATMSHAELSTEVANAALGRADVQDTIRQIHYRAVEQAALSKRVAALQSGSAAIRQQVTDLRRSLAARQRSTGAPLRVTIDGVADGDVIATGHTVDIVLTGANREFVTNASTQVRLEVGGWPIHLDERIWTLEGQNRLRFRLRIVVDASQPSPHPLIVAGALRLTRQHILALPRPDPPRLESLPGDVVGPSLLPLLTRRAQQQVHIVAPAVSTAESDPIERLLAEAPGAPASFVAADFLLSPDAFLAVLRDRGRHVRRDGESRRAARTRRHRPPARGRRQAARLGRHRRAADLGTVGIDRASVAATGRPVLRHDRLEPAGIPDHHRGRLCGADGRTGRADHPTTCAVHLVCARTRCSLRGGRHARTVRRSRRAGPELGDIRPRLHHGAHREGRRHPGPGSARRTPAARDRGHHDRGLGPRCRRPRAGRGVPRARRAARRPPAR
nr:hypothetical protein GCM10020092_033960 [Actinoplanes digitatis]